MPLPDEYKGIFTPGVLDLSIFVGGQGQSWELEFTLEHGTPPASTDLDGVTVTAEIRALDDLTVLAPITATIVGATAEGRVRLTMTRAIADAITWPSFGAPKGAEILRGRWHCALDDTVIHPVVLRGAVEVLR